MTKRDRCFFISFLSAIGLATGVAELATALAIKELRSGGTLDKLARDIGESFSVLLSSSDCDHSPNLEHEHE
jgi:hypothetical protein